MDFSFISDEQFRSSIDADFCELQACISAQSWKAVHVLAGSIIEALLTEHLVVSGAKPGGKDPLKLTLDEAIQACLEAKVLQKSTASLCDVIREYRNLIHPGRMIRLSQEVTPEGANIALSLVSLIVKDVSEKRKATYGPTAEQIVRKLRTDEHSIAVLAQLLQETNDHEKIKVVRALLPEAYMAEEANYFMTDHEVLSRLRIGYRKTFEVLPPAMQKEIAGNFAKKIREESSELIAGFGDAFFLASDISLLSSQDATIVVGHLKNRLEVASGSISDGLMRQTSTLASFIDLADISKFADAMIRLVLSQPESTIDKLMAYAGELFDAADGEKQELMDKRLGTWVKFAKEKDYPVEKQQRLRTLESKWFYIPF